MKLAMGRFQSLLIHMRVDLRRRNVSMTQHFLNDAQVSSVAQQVSRETMSEQVGIDIGFQSRTSGMRLNNLPDSGGCQFRPATREENLATSAALHKVWSFIRNIDS